MQIFCHNAEEANDVKCSQKYLELKLCKFQRLGSNFTRGNHQRCCREKDPLKSSAIFTRKQVLLSSCNFIKNETPAQGFSCEYWKNFQIIFFLEHPWMNLSILQQLLAVYFEIIYRWQLSSSEKSLVGEKIIHMFQGFYRFWFLLHTQTQICTHMHTNTHTYTHTNTHTHTHANTDV